MLVDAVRRGGLSGLLEGMTGSGLLYRGTTGYCGVYGLLGIDKTERFEHHPSVRVQRTVVVDRDPNTVYSFWRRLENLPRFIKHVESVSAMNGSRSHWIAKGPFGRKIEWDAEIVEDKPGHHIAWRSLDGSPIRHSGAVGFLPLDEGRATEVKVSMQYEPVQGALQEAVSKLLGDDPRKQMREDLEQFKKVMEGETRRTSQQWERETRPVNIQGTPPS